MSYPRDESRKLLDDLREAYPPVTRRSSRSATREIWGEASVRRALTSCASAG